MKLGEEKTTVISVGKATVQILQKIESQYDSQKAAVLAHLRNSVGKSLTEADDLWPLLFSNLPSEFLSQNGAETYEEKAVLATLQMYAMCMQGTSKNVQSDSSYKGSIGKSLAGARDSNDSKALDRRFNVLITTDTFSGLIYHLRQIIKVVKSKGNITINFPRLADDLFWFQKGSQRKICIRWAQEYYSQPQKSLSLTSGEEKLL
jgi:CRISPR system Cascade subunit CasB